MMRRALLLYSAILAFGVLSCSLIVGNRPTQCVTDADCSAFANTRCATDGLCKGVPVQPDGGGGGGAAPCSDNQTCITLLGSTKAFCDQASKTCLDLSNTGCSSVAGLLSNAEAVRLGALVPSTFGTNQAEGQAIETAVRQAVTGFNDGLAASVKPLVVVMCDETATGAIDILLNKVQVSAVIGEPSAALVAEATKTHTAVIAPFFLPGSTFALAYSLAPPPDLQAAAMTAVLEQQILPKLGANPTVALVNAADPYSTALGQALAADLAGAAVTVKSLAVAAQTSTDVTAQSIIGLAPSVVVMAGEAALIPVLARVEAAWPTSAPLPRYLLSDRLEVPLLYGTGGVAALAGADPGLRTRVLGTSPGALLSAPIAVDYLDGISGLEPRTAGAPFAYDAVYLLAYAAAAQHAVTPLTGDALAAGLLRLQGGTSHVDVGPAGRDAALAVLDAPGTAAITLAGITGPLTFTSRVATPDIQVWCVDKSGTVVAFADAGLTFAAASSTLKGTLAAACQ